VGRNLQPYGGKADTCGRRVDRANYSCKQAFALGFCHDDTRLRDRRFLAIDRERGLVYTSVEFDHGEERARPIAGSGDRARAIGHGWSA